MAMVRASARRPSCLSFMACVLSEYAALSNTERDATSGSAAGPPPSPRPCHNEESDGVSSAGDRA
jgi:hypothetical protein